MASEEDPQVNIGGNASDPEYFEVPLDAEEEAEEETVDRKSTRRTPVTPENLVCRLLLEKSFFFFNDTATTEIYTY